AVAVDPATGKASVSTTGLAVGSHTITAEFADGTNYAASTATATVTVNAAATTTTVAATPSPSTFGQSVTVTATITSGGAAVAAGTVTFRDGTTTLASAVPVDAATGKASFSSSVLAVGAHTITADDSDGA